MQQKPPRHVTVHLWEEGDWWISQCIEIDVASQGRTEEEAVTNLREALELYFEDPVPTVIHHIRTLDLTLA